MSKYAAIIINYKVLEDNSCEFRRVLIRYGKSKDADGIRTYYDTALIDVDPYFTDPDRSLTYEFTDDTYVLTKIRKKNGECVEVLNTPKRFFAPLNLNRLEPIEFGAEDDEIAKKIYRMFSK